MSSMDDSVGCNDFAEYLVSIPDSQESNKAVCNDALRISNNAAAMDCDQPCSHPKVLKSACISCGHTMNNGYGIAFEYIMMGLRLSHNEVARLRDAETAKILGNKKLILVLDLDHTLINSTRFDRITEEERYLEGQLDSLQEIRRGSLFMLQQVPYLVKLRPNVRSFLKRASKMFQMFIYTQATRPYAMDIAKLLDPDNMYFDSRVIARENSTETTQKNLDVLLGHERAVVIVDDSKEQWPNHKTNLIRIRQYDYFASSCNRGADFKSFSERKEDERENPGLLVSILQILKKIHNRFFSPRPRVGLPDRDVRLIMKRVRAQVLKGCKIILRHTGDHQCLTKARELGAVCTKVLDSSATHLVSMAAGPEELQWAKQKENKFLVVPQWINDCYMYWSRQPEIEYMP